MTKSILFNRSRHYPAEIDCFVLPGIILLPRSQVPVNVTDPAALARVDEALRSDRLLGVVQPQPHEKAEEQLFSSGTLGKITTFVERDEKHYFILLTGICRFDVHKELEHHKSYRRLLVDYHRYSFDPFEEKVLLQDREKLITLLKGYLSFHQIQATVDEFEGASDDDLITSLTMLCPFEPQEKQALLESPTAQNRCEMMTAFMELAVSRETGKDLIKH